MANENGTKGPSWFWIATTIGSAFLAGLVWWATSVWQLASTATTEIIEIKGQLKELNDNYASDRSWLDHIAQNESSDHDNITKLQVSQTQQQKQLDDLTGIHK